MMFVQMDSPKLNSPKYNVITHVRSSISLQFVLSWIHCSHYADFF